MVQQCEVDGEHDIWRHDLGNLGWQESVDGVADARLDAHQDKGQEMRIVYRDESEDRFEVERSVP